MTRGRGFSRRELLASSATAGLGLASAGRLGFAQGRREAGNGVERSQDLDHLQPAGPASEAYWCKVRAQFSLRDDLAFLNTGTLGAVPRNVLDVQERYSRELARDPSNNFRSSELASVRKRLAEFVNASPEEIALTHSTTEGLNLFAHGLDWNPGDEVLLGSQEHFSAHEAYQAMEQRRGIRIAQVEIPAQPDSVEQLASLYAKAITPRTKVLVLSLKTLLERERAQVKATKAGDVDAVRVSTHLYNTPQEIDRLLAGVSYLAEHADQFTGQARLG